MKKVLLTIFMSLAIIIASTTANAQSTPTPYSISAHGGYSWLNGVLGGEVQFGHVGLAAGWMPTKMPLSGTKVNSGCFNATYYSGTPVDDYSFYLSAGVSTAGYRYEDSWGGEDIEPITIIMLGSKYDSGGVYCKAGVGYGWCDQAGIVAFEILLGFKLFGN
jgi:hypothetical protein